MNLGVAIVGAVQTHFVERNTRQTYNELVYEVVSRLLDQTGVPMADIDSMVTASQDLWDGKTISSMTINEVVGAYLKSEAKVAGDGLQALLYGAARILAGAFDFTLVVAHCKESEGEPHPITQAMFDPYVQRPLGLDAAVAAALQARRYMAKSGATEEDLARVSVKCHRNGLRNSCAQRSGEFTVGQILDSPPLAEPLRELLASPRSDGACALLLASPKRARSFGSRAVWIAGLGNATDAYWTERELAESVALHQAATHAYRMADLLNPREEIDIAEISARYAHEELLYAEGLGLCARGQAQAWLASGATELGGSLPVNPSGGVLTGNPTTVAGLVRVLEGYLQLTDTAGEHQVPGAQVALAHGAGGICGQNQSVVILRRDGARPQ